MRLMIAAIGKLRAGPERTLYDRYIERALPLGRQVGLTPILSWEVSESHARTSQERKSQEAATLTNSSNGRGESLSTESFSTLLTQLRDHGHTGTCLLIGGPDGLHDSLMQRAHKVIAFGAMTMPHQLVRILLAEQIYRICTRLCGHPYHR
jgi:23S rRNA (pseudouridine1915-N3)-methyltransferase